MTPGTDHSEPLPLSRAIYNTPAGHILVQEILAKCEPQAIIPHDYQREAICHALDGEDVIATMATGTGKTGLFSFLMLVIRAISRNPSLALGGKTFPKDPCMIVVCPTKALQADMVSLLHAPPIFTQ